jgi:hypothetical protein
MAKVKKQPHDEKQELKPEMRDLILRFDAKDRRDEDARQRAEASKPRRRRGEKSAGSVAADLTSSVLEDSVERTRDLHGLP